MSTTNLSGTTIRGTNIIGSTSSSYVTSNLVLYFDPSNTASYAGTGTTINDLSGNNYTGTFYTLSTGTIGYQNDSGGAIATTSSANNNGGAIGVSYVLPVGAWTVEMFCKFTLQSYWASVWGSDLYNSSRGYWCIFQDATTMTLGTASLSGHSGASSGNFFTPNSSVANTSHWVWVNSGSAYTVYQNNATCTKTGVYNAPTNPSTVGTVFGSRHLNGATSNANLTDALPITMYLIRIYNKALSASEVNQNFQAHRSRFSL